MLPASSCTLLVTSGARKVRVSAWGWAEQLERPKGWLEVQERSGHPFTHHLISPRVSRLTPRSPILRGVRYRRRFGGRRPAGPHALFESEHAPRYERLQLPVDNHHPLFGLRHPSGPDGAELRFGTLEGSTRQLRSAERGSKFAAGSL